MKISSSFTLPLNLHLLRSMMSSNLTRCIPFVFSQCNWSFAQLLCDSYYYAPHKCHQHRVILDSNGSHTAVKRLRSGALHNEEEREHLNDVFIDLRQRDNNN